MKLINLTNGAVLADRVEMAATFKKRLTGLIGRRCLDTGDALILSPCNSVHTFFMSFPIDIIFLDRGATVLRVLERMRPFKFSPVVARSFTVAELPTGLLAATGTREGHQLQLIYGR